MERIEQKIKKSGQRSRIQQKIALAIFRMTTQSSSLAFASDALLRKRLGFESGTPAARMSQALHRLQKKGLLRRDLQKGSLSLTAAGKAYSKKLDAYERITIKKPRSWDGKWRIVIFDIWERRRATRNRFRSLLQKIGFVRIQDSVWAYPYDCEEVLAFIRTELRLGGGVLYLIAEGIEHDRSLRAKFDLLP